MKIVYTYRVVCQKLSAPSSGLHYLRHSGRAGPPRLSAGRAVYLRRIVGSRPRRGPRTPLHRRPARALPPAGRGRGCHQRVKPSAPKGSDQGRGAPFCRVSYSARDTSHMLFPASAVLARVCLSCAFLCGHRNLLVSSCSYSGVSKNHIRGLLNI